MSKIVLINPKNDLLSQDIPLGLLHIGTILDKEGYAVRIIDAAKEPDYENLIAREIKDALLVGISALTTEVKNAIEISDYIKNIHSDIPIIWGGWHPTLFPEQTCSDKSVDFVCIGEGEYTMLEVVKALETGTSFENIKGLAYKDKGVLKMNSRRDFVNMEELPPINYDLINISEYVNHPYSWGRMISYQSSRGCPHRCTFCINTVTGNQKYRTKSAKKVVDEIQILIDKYNINFVGFIDDNFFVSIKRAREICEELIKRNLNIKWFADCRVDYFRPNFVDENFLDLAEKSGLSNLGMGAESGSQRILNLLKKDITVKQILASARILSKYNNIGKGYGFILGLPGETKEDVIASLKLANEIVKICSGSMYGIGFGFFTPYPRCELTEDLIKKGFFNEPKTLREWSANDVRAQYARRHSYSEKTWHKNPKFLRNVGYYGELGYHSYTDTQLKNYHKLFRHRMYMYPDLFFILIARIRMKHLFFKIPIDRLIFATYKDLRKNIAHLLHLQ